MANFQLIKTIAHGKGITLADVSNQVGITQQGLSKIIRDNVSRTDTIEKIANALGVSVSVFFDDAPASVNATGDNSIAISGSGNEVVQKQLLDMLAEKDARIAELTDRLLAIK